MSDLGEPRVDLSPRSMRAWAIGGFVLAGAAGFAVAVLAPYPAWVAIVLLIGVVLLPIVINGLRNWNTQLQVHERGVVLRYRGRERRIPWSDVRSISHDVHEPTDDPASRTEDCVIALRDGGTLALRGWIGLPDPRGVFRPRPLITDCARLRKEHLRAKTELR